jgi:electron transport complex protein RnfG
MSGRLPETARLVITLTAAGLVSGLAIVGAYELTLPAIEANKAAALERAVLEVLPGAATMERRAWRDGALVPAPDAARGTAAGAAGEPAVYAGFTADGALVGYAVPGEGAGFQDTIRLLFGFDPARRRIVGLEILESRETPGLGDRIYKDPAFDAEFSDLAVDPQVELVKGGGDAANQVDAITGATISSRAVVTIVNQTAGEWLDRLPAAAGADPAGGAAAVGEATEPAGERAAAAGAGPAGGGPGRG